MALLYPLQVVPQLGRKRIEHAPCAFDHGAVLPPALETDVIHAKTLDTL